QVAPRGLRHHDIARLRRPALTLSGILRTELDPADRRTRGVTEARVEQSAFAGLRCRANPEKHGGDRQRFSLSPEMKHRGPRFLLGPHFAWSFCVAAKSAKSSRDEYK